MQLNLFMKIDRIGVDAMALFDTDTKATVVLKGSKLSATISDAPTFRGVRP